MRSSKRSQMSLLGWWIVHTICGPHTFRVRLAHLGQRTRASHSCRPGNLASQSVPCWVERSRGETRAPCGASAWPGATAGR